MTPFAILFVAHLIGDFLFQTSWMAMYKATRWSALFTHVTVYTLVVSVIAWIGFGGLPLMAIVFIYATHIVLDRRGFVQWWVKTVMRTAEGPETKWISIVVDQIFHILVLVFILYM